MARVFGVLTFGVMAGVGVFIAAYAVVSECCDGFEKRLFQADIPNGQML